MAVYGWGRSGWVGGFDLESACAVAGFDEHRAPLRMPGHMLDFCGRALTGTWPVGWAGRFPFRCLECVH